MNRDDQCLGYLEVLEVYLRRNLRDRTILRSCAAHWYAFSRDDKRLFNRSGDPLWLNKPDPRNRIERDLLQCFDEWISPEAMMLIEKPELFVENDPTKSVIIEHAVPLNVLRGKLRELDDPNPGAIEACLRQFYAVGVITYEQNQKLDSGKLRSRMPDGWNGVDPYARYREVGIRNAGRACHEAWRAAEG
jgi:hypothetical protein